MFRRFCVLMGAMAGVAPLFIGCSASQVDTVTVSPASQTIAVGQTAQFTATGTITHGKHPASTADVTGLVSWTSSAPAVATVSSSGLTTAVSAGTTTITAAMKGFGGTITSTAVVTVTGSGGSGGSGGGSGGSADITAVTVIPGSQAVASPGQTSTFLAIGTTSNGATQGLTSQVAWMSSSNQIATINSAGVATAASKGTATITALFTNPDKSVASGTATFQVVGGTTELVTALDIYPGSQSLIQAQQTQFFVLGTEGSSGLQVDETAGVDWTSSNTNVASVGTAGSGTPGLATAVGAGSATITAKFTNPDKSVVVATADLAVSIGAAQEPLLSIQVVPGDVAVSNKGMTAQYLAFGTFSTAPTVRDITNSVTWLSTLPEVASINSCGSGAGSTCGSGTSGGPSGGLTGEYAGLATSQGLTGNSVIYAIDNTSNPDGTLVLSNPQTFTCKDANANVCVQSVPTPQFATITVYIEGAQTSPSGQFVTAPSDTGTANLIHCGKQYSGSGGQVCTGTYAVGSKVTLTENLAAGSQYFGGWSTGSGCVDSSGTPLTAAQLATSTTCTISVNGKTGLNGNASVGVIFY
ncbi:MAG TPA: Ig-like domain-containing protein [Terracidiphilus sp.]|jgi:uncharacterized protein YjdB